VGTATSRQKKIKQSRKEKMNPPVSILLLPPLPTVNSIACAFGYHFIVPFPRLIFWGVRGEVKEKENVEKTKVVEKRHHKTPCKCS